MTASLRSTPRSATPRAVCRSSAFPASRRTKAIEAFLASSRSRSGAPTLSPTTGARHQRLRRSSARDRAASMRRARGILLMHDIHPATALALPKLLSELKANGYHIVHVVPPASGRPRCRNWRRRARHDTWPRVVKRASHREAPPGPANRLQHRHPCGPRPTSGGNPEKAANRGDRGLGTGRPAARRASADSRVQGDAGPQPRRNRRARRRLMARSRTSAAPSDGGHRHRARGEDWCGREAPPSFLRTYGGRARASKSCTLASRSTQCEGWCGQEDSNLHGLPR